MPLNKNVLSKYINPIFIETGTYTGQCSLMAQSIGFEVYTIEFSDQYYNNCKKLFEGNKNIHLYYGNSGEELPKILKRINLPATIWLDAHPPDDILTMYTCPIIFELNAILQESKRLKFKVLVDDMRLFGDLDTKRILHVAKQIGSISYEESKCGKQDVLVIS